MPAGYDAGQHRAERADTDTGKAQLRRLETCGRPVVAAVNGSALGGGLELALACHHRVVADDPRIEIGFPEVTLGLIPGAGGIVRTVRLLGIVDALMTVLLRGQRLRPAAALEAGLVHEIAPRDELIARAKAWIATNPNAQQPWDVKGYKIPGGTPATPALAANLPAFPATLRKELKGAPYLAPRNILAAAVEGAQVDFDTAIDIEGRYFADAATSQIARNMIKAFFFDLQAANSRAPKDIAPVQTVGVLGAGMMGAGIAYVCAKAGMTVLLKDVSVEAAERGKAYSERLLDKAIGRGRPVGPRHRERLAGAAVRHRPGAGATARHGCVPARRRGLHRRLPRPFRGGRAHPGTGRGVTWTPGCTSASPPTPRRLPTGPRSWPSPAR